MGSFRNVVMHRAVRAMQRRRLLPVIPTVNDDGQDIEATALLLAGIQGITRIELLPYHKLGASKYARLGMPYQLDGLEPPSAPEMEAIAQRMRAHGLEVHVGS